MSDGISEGYRAARAWDQFEKRWLAARAEMELLGYKEKFEALSIGDVMARLCELSPSVRISNYDEWRHQLVNGKLEGDYQRTFKVEITTNVSECFTANNLKDALYEAIMFAEWTRTPEGSGAAKDYQDY